ncbi:MAG TPA: BamA/TamA family outer membrane protein, partial [Polyangiaceae bacterium]|nr:BamA/TamA family outer membrane protein [Polyangiaceae bacterium]
MRPALVRFLRSALLVLLALTSAPSSALAQTAPAADKPQDKPAQDKPAQDKPAPDTWGTENSVPEPGSAAAGTEAPGAAPCIPCREQAGSADLSPVRYTLEGIDVRGNGKTSTRVVLRYVPFAAGDVIDVDAPKLELARFRLLGTGFFRSVEFSLKKGAKRGFVILVIDVVERPTVVINDISLGLSADADPQGEKRPLTAYAGLDVAETNLAGTGITLGAAAAVAQNQYALRVRFLDPAFLGGSWMVGGTLLYNDAQDFFGNARVYLGPYNSNGPTQRVDYAVASYTRFGGAIGVGRDLSLSTQFWLHYRLEAIDASVPVEASHLRGFDREPIDFDIVPGRSVLSTIRGSVQHDTRDHPFLPTQGWLLNLTGELALLPAMEDYSYQRLVLQASHWWKMPWKEHVLRLELFGGAISGNAPFFEQFYVGDFSDFLP